MSLPNKRSAKELRTSLYLAAGVAGLLSLAACDAPSEPPSAHAAPPSSVAKSSAESSAAAAPSAPASVNARRQKAHETTAAARLGVLPEGVGIKVGQPAPDAEIRDAGGKAVRLSSLWSKDPVMLVFYRGGWCPYCNFQIRKLTKAYGDFEKAGVKPVAISVDTASETAKTQGTYDIPFPVLSDPTLVAHEAFRVIQAVPDERVGKLRTMGIDLERASGQSHHKIAIPAVFLVDTSGIVRWAHADPSYKVRPSPKQLLAAVAKTKLSP